MSDTRADASVSSGRYHHGDLRNALLEAGWSLLAEGGVEATTLRAAARRAGVSHAAPYHHFADKAALITAMSTQAFEELRVALQTAWDEDDSGSVRLALAATGVAYVRFACARPHVFALMNRPELHGIAMAAKTADPSGRSPEESVLVNVAREAFAVLEQGVAACQEAGELPAGDPRLWALMAWSGVHGLSTLVIDDWVRPEQVGVPDVGALASIMLGAMAHGLRPDAPASPSGGRVGP